MPLRQAALLISRYQSPAQNLRGGNMQGKRRRRHVAGARSLSTMHLGGYDIPPYCKPEIAFRLVKEACVQTKHSATLHADAQSAAVLESSQPLRSYRASRSLLSLKVDAIWRDLLGVAVRVLSAPVERGSSFLYLLLFFVTPFGRAKGIRRD